eukprot:TRINITY_DN4436_c0_g1_i1.p2 TRINITY_DN4436_c0_g1~~TRINITY_DN4436_c0_g1_i1.p2  ORF type:complete len:126 (-),score=42.26 TRINITY_DN4436_c0_g1_i1:12-389(-)
MSTGILSQMSRELASKRAVATLPTNVEAVNVIFSKLGEGQTGARKLISEEFPGLKYNNPEVAFSFEKKTDGDTKAKVVVKYEDGKQDEHDVYGLRTKDIMEKLTGVEFVVGEEKEAEAVVVEEQE